MREERYRAVIVLAGNGPAVDELFEKLKCEVRDLFPSLTCEFLESGDADAFVTVGKHVDIAVITCAGSSPPIFIDGSRLSCPLHLFIDASKLERAARQNRERRIRNWRYQLIEPMFSVENKVDAVIAHIRSERLVPRSALAA